MNQVITFFQSLFSSTARQLAVCLGIVWAWMEPTLPYALMCVFAVCVDCLTAYRLNCRVKKKFPDAGVEGRLKSSHMMKTINDLAILYCCILLARGVDNHLLDHLGNLHLDQYIAAIFVFATFVSILENESSCNGSTWARLVQKVVANKVSRHIDMPAHEIEAILKGEEETAEPAKPRRRRKNHQPKVD